MRRIQHSLPALLGFMIVSVVSAIAGCGGGGDSGAGQQSSGNGSSLSSAQRAVALDAINAKWHTLSHTNRYQDALDMVAFIKSRAEFSDAGLSDHINVWGLFRDGVSYGMFLNDPNSTPNDPPIDRGKASRDAAPALPASTSAALYNVFLSEEGANGQIANMLGNHGYKPFSLHGSLDDFKANINSGTGAVFTNTHGAHFQGRDKQMHFYLLTTQRYHDTDEKPGSALAQDLADGTLCIGSQTENGNEMPYYCFGPNFVTKYLSFAPNSIWVNGACQGFDQEFMQACFTKGLSAYTGWTESVERSASTRAALFLADRLLGANADSDFPSDPHQRPFDLTSVMSNMSKTAGANSITNPTLDVSNWIEGDPTWSFPFLNIPGIKTVHAQCQYAYAAGPPAPQTQFSLLAPSISAMTVMGKDLKITGIFGNTPGKVTVDGTEVPADWGATSITAHLPAFGQPGFAGDVVVSVNDVKSNVAQLTLWPVKFHLVSQEQLFGTDSSPDPNTSGQTIFTDYSGSHVATADVTVYLRCDVRDPRGQPGQTPPDLTLEPLQSSSLAQGSGMSNSVSITGWSFSGTETTHTHSAPVNSAEHTQAIAWSMAKSPQPPLLFDGSSPFQEQLDNGQISFHHADRTLMTWITARIRAPLHSSVTNTFIDGNPNTSGQDTTDFLLFTVAQAQDHSQPYPLKLDTGYGIQAGQITLSNTATAISNTQITVSWSATPAQFPPDPDAARSARRNRKR